MNTPFFKPVQPQVRFPDIENEVLAFWREADTFRASLRRTEGQTPYVFYDGPPFATGLPHYGHLLAGTLKDIVPRYWTMRGRHVERRFGWDCHGLPVENEVEKLHGLGKHAIEDEWGIRFFNERCRSIVLRYTSQWQTIVERMGRWVDFGRQYRTMDPGFMESIWWVFRQVWEKGLVYQGFRVQPYCPRCATPLSNFEVNEGYKDTRSPSITITFPLAGDPSVHFLVWTTTPWTLPSNVALAVGPDITYVKVKDKERFYILAKERLPAYYRSADEYQIVEEMPGTKLEGLRYEPLFGYFKDRSPKFFAVTTADFVSTEDGTGIVHMAPAFGEDDFQVGARLGLPVVCPVDAEGKFTADVPEYAGQLVFDTDEPIVKRLKAMGRLVHKGVIEHRYPFCYRCDTALIYKAITTWFLRIEPLKATMLEGNRGIHWVPDHLQNGRFGKGVESAPDWNISRNRYWGTPLPIWQCGCGHTEVVGSIEQLHRLAGAGDTAAGRAAHAAIVSSTRAWLAEEWKKPHARAGDEEAGWTAHTAVPEIPDNDLHRHIVDELALTCPACRTGRMQRIPEVLDCWFESGSMPYAQNHYPFENRDVFESSFPADFIAEGLDQTRGWFYTLTVLSSALFGKPAFRNVIVNGIILSKDGRKLSKRLKNYTPPEDVLEKLGADALRLFLINSPAVKAEDLRFTDDGLMEMTRAMLLPFWNAYSFFVTYAAVDGFRPGAKVEPGRRTELDRWIVSLLNHVIATVNREMEQYNLYRVVPALVDFIGDLTNWYIRRSRRRFWKSENDGDKKDAYATLYYVLVEFTKVMAPFLPFLSEAIYRNLVGGRDAGRDVSVHLQPFPQAREDLIDRDLEDKMALVLQAVTMGRALRSRFTLKTRQPLAECIVVVRSDRTRKLLAEMEQLIADELNVKKVVFSGREEDVVHVAAKANFRRLGKAFGPRMKEAAAVIELFTPEQIGALSAGKALEVLGRELTAEDIEIRRTKREGVEVETGGEITIALDTTITPELRSEGLAREFVNRVQNVRKARAFDVTDRIRVACSCPDDLRAAIERHRDYVCNETLTESLEFASGAAGTESEAIEIDGLTGSIAVSRSRPHG